MGAWIETKYLIHSFDCSEESHSLWVRGLKLERSNPLYPGLFVALLVGAWIETSRVLALSASVSSHSLWVRGLKQLPSATNNNAFGVALLVGAWIETSN